MRTATKYLMDKEQAAIVRVIGSRRFLGGISEPIAILCFIAEFPEHFRKDFALKVFLKACSTSYYPSSGDLELLMVYPHILVAMMKYREGKLKPAVAVWNAPPTPTPGVAEAIAEESVSPITPLDKWWDDQLESLGLGR